jgi:hypothetical protein
MRTEHFKVMWQRRDGVTLCTVKNNEDQIIAEGVTKKHVKDVNNKKISRYVSFRRAMNRISEEGLLNKQFRQELWETFRNGIKQPERSIRLPEEQELQSA